MSSQTGTTSSTGPADAGHPPRIRADAQRNREQIPRAAGALFVERGPDVPLDEIARRAGVGIATLYRRSPRREDLILGVAADVFGRLADAAREATAAEPDPLRALRRFMHAALDLKVGAVMPVLFSRVGFGEVLQETHGEAADLVDALPRRARSAGPVRPDIAFGDISLLVIRLSRPLPGSGFPDDVASPPVTSISPSTDCGPTGSPRLTPRWTGPPSTSPGSSASGPG